MLDAKDGSDYVLQSLWELLDKLKQGFENVDPMPPLDQDLVYRHEAARIKERLNELFALFNIQCRLETKGFGFLLEEETVNASLERLKECMQTMYRNCVHLMKERDLLVMNRDRHQDHIVVLTCRLSEQESLIHQLKNQIEYHKNVFLRSEIEQNRGQTDTSRLETRYFDIALENELLHQQIKQLQMDNQILFEKAQDMMVRAFGCDSASQTPVGLVERIEHMHLGIKDAETGSATGMSGSDTGINSATRMTEPATEMNAMLKTEFRNILESIKSSYNQALGREVDEKLQWKAMYQELVKKCSDHFLSS